MTYNSLKIAPFLLLKQTKNAETFTGTAFKKIISGERGIRTPGPFGSTVFKTAAFDRSAISPAQKYVLKVCQKNYPGRNKYFFRKANFFPCVIYFLITRHGGHRETWRSSLCTSTFFRCVSVVIF